MKTRNRYLVQVLQIRAVVLNHFSFQKNASGLLTGLEALENSTKKAETSGLVNTTSDIGDDFDIFADMIQTPQFHHPHHRAAFQVSLYSEN